ncbi:MAG: aspartate/glutamate racemase family protein [Candidatus Caenarcaniphilales bacterium]|nr:aspartate/glutamate racemase family protein [Candidatus Caenarcaniphilales bacterium]
MNKIGLLGGMSCESTVEYYKIINQEVRKKTSPLSSAKIVLNSMNFQEIADLQHADKWDELNDLMANAALDLEKCGAKSIFICTNLMHKTAPAIEAKVSIPLVHIADALAAQVKADGFNKVGLLGAIFTMEHDFYRKRLEEKHGIEMIVPGKQDRDEISRIIYEELCCGIISETAKKEYLKIIEELAAKGAQGVALACTEIPLLVENGEASVPLYDTTKLHALAAVDACLGAEACLN